MKISDLERGMLLRTAHSDMAFLLIKPPTLEKSQPSYVAVRNETACLTGDCVDVLLYLGTAKTLGLTDSTRINGVNQYVMANEKICGVDPAGWRLIEPAST